MRHELLEYVRRIDLGSFNAVTIGYGLASRIESDLQALMKTLDDPPERPERFLPGDTQVRTEDPSKPGSGRPAIPGAGDSTKADGTTPGSQEGTGPTAGTPGSGGAGTSASGSQTDSTLPKGDGAGGGTQQSVYLILALVMGIMVLGAILLVIQRAKKPKVAAKRPADKRTVAPTGLKDGRQ